MIHDQKVLKYKGKIVFEKISMTPFQRMPKLYEKNEACFMFIIKGEFSVRAPDQFLSFKQGQGFLSKYFNYFFESNKVQRKSSDRI